VTDPLEWKGKGELTIIFQNVHTVTDCLDVCKFATFAESLDSFAAQYEAITGVPSSAEHMLKVGEQYGGSKGHVCELDDMLKEYYDKRGWVNGVVPDSKLKELEII
jgi:aldehyde:ferredoxin oxidoreductase